MMASGPVRAVAKAAGGMARHAAWWLRYRVGGHTRPAPDEPRRRPPAGRGSSAE
jgi:hypothetical protein